MIPLKIEKTSMLYWFPVVEKLGIPVPKTAMIKTADNITCILQRTGGDFMTDRGIAANIDMDLVYARASIIGYPLFLRTDMTSNKHSWGKTCYVKKESEIVPHLKKLMTFSQMADMITGIPFCAVVLREYISMWTLFHAFNGMPVNPEWRIFAKNGRVRCSHWYWIKDAIKNPDVEDYEDRLRESEIITALSLDKLERYARKVSEAMPGQEWSIDFCKGKNGQWYLIDMAVAEKSWHDPSCRRLEYINDFSDTPRDESNKASESLKD